MKKFCNLIKRRTRKSSLLYGWIALWCDPNSSVCVRIYLIFQEFTTCLLVKYTIKFLKHTNIFACKWNKVYLHRHDSICHPSYRGVFYIPRLLDWRETESQTQLYGCCKHRFLHSSPTITRIILLVCSVTRSGLLKRPRVKNYLRRLQEQS